MNVTQSQELEDERSLAKQIEDDRRRGRGDERGGVTDIKLDGVSMLLLGTSSPPGDMMRAARDSLTQAGFERLMARTAGRAPTAAELCTEAEFERHGQWPEIDEVHPIDALKPYVPAARWDHESERRVPCYMDERVSVMPAPPDHRKRLHRDPTPRERAVFSVITICVAVALICILAALSTCGSHP